MSAILKGILSMPDELFWSDEYISRIQHNDARLRAVEEIERLESEVQRLESLLEWKHVSQELPKKEGDYEALLFCSTRRDSFYRDLLYYKNGSWTSYHDEFGEEEEFPVYWKQSTPLPEDV